MRYQPHLLRKCPLKMPKNHLCQISEASTTLQSMDENRFFSKCNFDCLFLFKKCYIFIHMDHSWHLVYSEVMIIFFEIHEF